MSANLFVHIAGGSLAVAGGYAALFAPKGGWLHRRAGVLFVYAIIAMGIGAMFVGLARGKPSWLGGPFVIYLRVVARRRRPSGLVTRLPLAASSQAQDGTQAQYQAAVQANP